MPALTADAVLVTRPAPGCDATAHALTERGYRPVTAPMLRIVPLTAALPDPATLQAILVTSASALPCLPPTFHRLKLFAVGAATAAHAAALGFETVESADGDAAALAALCRRRCAPAGGALLLAVGRGQGAPLAGELCNAGYSVVRTAVYAARPVATLPAAATAAWRQHTLRAALFFSAETARVFVRLAEAAGTTHAGHVDALAIGGPAAAVLVALPWRSVRVADRPTQDALLALLT